MSARLICLLAAFCLGPASLLRAGGLLDLVLGKPEVEVITVTDMTPAGRLRPAPSPEKPVYYVAAILGFQDFGGIIAGDKIPPKDEVVRNISAILAKQGFLPATETSPAPTLVLAFAWGTLNADLFHGPNPDLPPQQLNRAQILKFLGGYKVGFSEHDFDPLMPANLGLTLMNPDANSFYAMAQDDFYVAVVTAYDLASVRNGRRQQLWMTRISCPSRGFWLEEVLPTMLAIAGPNLGRETDRPVWFRAPDKFRTDVKLGELQLLEYLGTGKPQPDGPKPTEAGPPQKP